MHLHVYILIILIRLKFAEKQKMPLHTFLLSQQTSLVYRSFTKLQGDSKRRAWQHLMLQEMIKILGTLKLTKGGSSLRENPLKGKIIFTLTVLS